MRIGAKSCLNTQQDFDDLNPLSLHFTKPAAKNVGGWGSGQ